MSKWTKKRFLGCLGAICLASFWIVFFAVLILFLFLKDINKITKKFIVGGLYRGGLADHRMMIYTDATYYIPRVSSGLDYHSKLRWTECEDSISLNFDGKVCAKILGVNLIDIYDDRFWALEKMQIVKFDPPKIVDFGN